MALSQWSRVKPLKDPMAVKNLEEKYGYALPLELKECITANNGGRPVPDTIRLENGEECDVKGLLSLNEEDSENIYRVLGYFNKNFGSELFPFASDSAGNYYCVRDGKIVLWTQDGEIYNVCGNFNEFLEALYELI